ncbi:unnamed protein product [Cochlearia groenlandica]
MLKKTLCSMDFAVTLVIVIVFLISPIIITNAADSLANNITEDPIKCTPWQQNIPPPPPSCLPPPPPPPTYTYTVDYDFGEAARGESFTIVNLIVFGVVGFMIVL